MTWVIDASVALRWVIDEEIHPRADRVLERIITTPELFAVPELFSFEVYSLLQKTHPQAQKVFVEAIIPILQSGIFRQAMTSSLVLSADKFMRRGLTGYDACYVAVTEAVKGTWLTFDKRAHNILASEGISCNLGESLPWDW